MRSSRELQLPPGWSPARRGRIIALAFAAPFLVLLLLVIGSGGLLSGLWGLGGWAIAMAALIVLSAYNLLRRHYRRRLSVEAIDLTGGIEPTLRIRYSREVVVLRVVGALLLGVGFILLGLGAWSGGFTVFSVAMTAVGLLCLGWLGAWYVRGIRVGELTLSPELIRLRVDDVDLAVAWDDLAAVLTSERTDRYRIVTWRRLHLVAPHVTGWQPPRRRLRKSLGDRPDPPVVDIQCDMIDVDDALIYWLLRFYHCYPLARPELGRQAGLARVRDRMFLNA